jgi:hypothetical protein
MSAFGLQAQIVAALSVGVGAVMVRMGLRSGLISARNPPRRCPSCGKLLQSRACAHCTRR